MAVVATIAAAGRRSLTTPERYRAATGSEASDALLTSLVSRASATIERFLGRILAEERVREAILFHGPGQLILERKPVSAVHAVTVGGKAQDVTAFQILDPAAGLVSSTAMRDNLIWDAIGPGEGGYGWRPDRHASIHYEVDYTGGWTMPDDTAGDGTLPADLEDACCTLVRYQLESMGRLLGVTSERLGDYAVSYGTGDPAGWAMVRPLLEPYRSIV